MALLIMTLLIAPGCGYNDIQGLDEETNAAWSEVQADDSPTPWPPRRDPDDLAYILYQVPVLVAVHASEMLTIK